MNNFSYEDNLEYEDNLNINQAKSTKPKIPNQNYQTKPCQLNQTHLTERNIPNQTFQSNKIKAPTLNS